MATALLILERRTMDSPQWVDSAALDVLSDHIRQDWPNTVVHEIDLGGLEDLLRRVKGNGVHAQKVAENLGELFGVPIA
jgi:hypothetical protein